MKKKVLFLIHDVGHGGAEKVLVNLVNNMDQTKFDITVIALFAGGVNEQFLNPGIRFQAVFPRMIPGNSKIMKLFSPKTLHKALIKDTYDIEIAFLEGPDSRIVSGCRNPNTKLVYWIHCTMHDEREFCGSFRSMSEANRCYGQFDLGVFVSKDVKEAFNRFCLKSGKREIKYNTNDSKMIREMSEDSIRIPDKNEFRIIAVGKIEQVKGFQRLAEIHNRLLQEGYKIHTYILGEGSQQKEIEEYTRKQGVADTFTFLGYQTNPYKYVGQSDLFVCSSYSEGFSTAATEALIVGTPVCTTEVSGMREMLGDNEYGVITENSDEGLYQGIKSLLDDPTLLTHYKKQAEIRGKVFSTEKTVKAVEDMLLNL